MRPWDAVLLELTQAKAKKEEQSNCNDNPLYIGLSGFPFPAGPPPV
jgi:hypothetical protein